MPGFAPAPRRIASAGATVIVAVVVVAVVLGLRSPTLTQPSVVDGLPHSSQSWLAAQRIQTLPDARSEAAVIVYRREDGRRFSVGQLATLRAMSARLVAADEAVAPRSRSGSLGPLVLSPDGSVALASVAVSTAPNLNVVTERILAIRAVLSSSLPRGIQSAVTGAPAFSADLGQVFHGADHKLLVTTVLVVALLLIATYRSPLLWLVPLAVVGAADQLSSHVAALLAPHVGVRLDGAATGIADVLVFGAGTDYALLLIARYREQLGQVEDRFAAMRIALAKSSGSIVASGTTVTISLATLFLASMAGTHALGLAGAIGIVSAMAMVYFVLPAALTLCGRRVFWPLVPRAGDATRHDGRVFARIGGAVAKRPGAVIAGALTLLALASVANVGLRQGLSTTQQFTATPESVVGQRILASAFPAGSAVPVVIVVSTRSVAAAEAVARAVPGVASVQTAAANATWTELDATSTAAPGSAAAFRVVTSLRSALATVADAHAVVGGESATTLDAERATNRDTWLLVPLVLLVVLTVLVVLLGSLVAPLLLLATVIASFGAALGLAWLVFVHLDHYPALATGVPFYAFLFLVALGVDYNIFLVSRAKQERGPRGAAQGMLTALASTGGVITSAGVLLAAVFAVLGVLPLIELTQVGVIVGIGVLLDTLLVRTVLVPALAVALGERFWWPSRRGIDGHVNA